MSTHPGLHRPVLLLGAEIGVVLVEVVLACVVVVMGGVHPLALLAGLGSASLGHLVALGCARVDPLLPRLYLRSLRHGDYLPARPRLGARSRPAAASVPGR